jgi:hypothetical protein
MQDCSYFLKGLCTNTACPYRHVKVNSNAPVCEDFLKGYCADGDESLRQQGSALKNLGANFITPRRRSNLKEADQIPPKTAVGDGILTPALDMTAGRAKFLQIKTTDRNSRVFSLVGTLSTSSRLTLTAMKLMHWTAYN